MAVSAKRSYLTGKRHAIELYVATAEQPWAPFVRTLYARCALEWHYRIPDSDDDHHALRELCLSVLAFENHYIQSFPC